MMPGVYSILMYEIQFAVSMEQRVQLGQFMKPTEQEYNRQRAQEALNEYRREKTTNDLRYLSGQMSMQEYEQYGKKEKKPEICIKINPSLLNMN